MLKENKIARDNSSFFMTIIDFCLKYIITTYIKKLLTNIKTMLKYNLINFEKETA